MQRITFMNEAVDRRESRNISFKPVSFRCTTELALLLSSRLTDPGSFL